MNSGIPRDSTARDDAEQRLTEALPSPDEKVVYMNTIAIIVQINPARN